MANLKTKHSASLQHLLDRDSNVGSLWGFFCCHSDYLLTDVVEASVLSVAFVGFSQDRVEGFVAVPPGCPGVPGDREHCYVHLGNSC